MTAFDEAEHARYERALRLVDEANADDPNRESDDDGREVAKEVLYARRMTAVLSNFAPEAGVALRLAARCQHIRRWEIPRSDYPMDRAGYHKWRTTLYRFHAETAGRILAECGYESEVIERVQFLVQKKSLRSDPETQTLEDVICLVFLRYYLAPFAAAHPDEKVVEILQKTWAKMSPAGHAAALALVDALPAGAARLVRVALADAT